MVTLRARAWVADRLISIIAAYTIFERDNHSAAPVMSRVLNEISYVETIPIRHELFILQHTYVHWVPVCYNQ